MGAKGSKQDDVVKVQKETAKAALLEQQKLQEFT